MYLCIYITVVVVVVIRFMVDKSPALELIFRCRQSVENLKFSKKTNLTRVKQIKRFFYINLV